MKLVAKYTFVVVAALGVASAGLAYFHVERDRVHFEQDMRTDHRVVGRVLQALVSEIWRDQTATVERMIGRTSELLDLANAGGGTTRFAWVAGPTGGERQQIEGHEFVSRFPVSAGDATSGAILVRESLDDTDRAVTSEITYTVVSFLVIVVVCVIASLALGGFLVGQPNQMLVDKARRVGRRDFSAAVELRRSDELGELANEMNTMSDALARALAQIDTATEERIQAVEQLRHAERLATVGRLAAGVAHELGTPLSIVSGHAQMISGREVVADGIVASATAIDREAERMGRIVRQLLDFARRKGPAGSTSDPAEVARRCLMLLGPMAEHNHVTSVVAAPAEPLRTVMDEVTCST